MEPVKNKKLTYLLLCAAMAVWGIVVYRVFFNEPAGDDFRAPAIRVLHEPYNQYVDRNDTFKLALNYRDPFTGKQLQSMETVAAVAAGPKIPKVIVQPPPPLNWSAIKYSGYMINPATKKMVTILSVNGTERMLAEGESLQGVKLLKNKKDSVLLSWMGKQKYIRQ